MASVVAIEPVQCILVRRSECFALFERHPTRRISEVAGGRVETRFARPFLSDLSVLVRLVEA